MFAVIESISVRISSCNMLVHAWITCAVNCCTVSSAWLSDIMHLPMAFHTCSHTSGDQAGQSMVGILCKAYRVIVSVWARALSRWKIVFWMVFMKGMTTGLITLSTNWRAVIVPLTTTKAVLLSERIDHQTITQRVWLVWRSEITPSWTLSPTHRRSCCRKSFHQKQNRNLPLNTTDCHSRVQ